MKFNCRLAEKEVVGSKSGSGKKNKKKTKALVKEETETIESTNDKRDNTKINKTDDILAFKSDKNSQTAENNADSATPKKRRKRTAQVISDDRLKAYGLNPKKVKYMKTAKKK